MCRRGLVLFLPRTWHRQAGTLGARRELGVSNRDPFLQGITTEVLNPKTALFFLSFIPQFVSPARGHATLQFLTLGTISVVLNTSVDLLVVLFAGVLVQKLGNHPAFNRRQRTASGVGMIGLGVYVAAR